MFNGTSCGLNAATWSSNFWLPTSTTMTRLLSYNYQVVDVDIGDMFLNFPLHESLNCAVAVDLTPSRQDLLRELPYLKDLLKRKSNWLPTGLDCVLDGIKVQNYPLLTTYSGLKSLSEAII